MSRIDQAFSALETAKGAPAQDKTLNTGSSSPLVDYPREGSNGTALDEPSAALPLRETALLEPDEGRTARAPKRGALFLDNADILARLVTGAASGVPVEQYRRLAAVLHDEQVNGNLKTVMITSALPGEGKTLTVVNLALTLSGSYGRRVLVIDADLRAPSLHQILGLRNTRGLSDALHERRETLPFIEVSDRLSVLTAGLPGPTPLADLTSERLAEIVRECAATFDWVLMDTPPVGLLPDAQVLARLTGAVVFVIAAGVTPAAAVERSITELGSESIIGTVLNRVEDRRIPEANYYSDYYSQRDEQ